MKLIKLLTLTTFITTAFTSLRADENKNYFNLGIGGDFSVTGYEGRDTRFAIQVEAGHDFIALPVVLSFGQDILIVGVKPRLQYWLSPVKGVPQLSFAPGVGPLFNYWHFSQSGISANVYELGAHLSGQVRYQITPEFNMTVMPVGLDMNFWRHATASTAGGSASASSSEFGMIYTTTIAVGINF